MAIIAADRNKQCLLTMGSCQVIYRAPWQYTMVNKFVISSYISHFICFANKTWHHIQWKSVPLADISWHLLRSLRRRKEVTVSGPPCTRAGRGGRAATNDASRRDADGARIGTSAAQRVSRYIYKLTVHHKYWDLLNSIFRSAICVIAEIVIVISCQRLPQ